MTLTEPITIHHPVVVHRDEGHHHHFFNHLGTVKVASGEAPSGLTAVEFVGPRDFGAPLHLHREEDEMFYVVEGEVAYTAGEEEHLVGPGAVVMIPAGTPHTFQILSEEARLFTITAGSSLEPAFDVFVKEMGEELDEPVIPAPIDIDPGHVAMMCDAHGMDVLGPPPSPR